jgi:hypothetical protein
VRDDAWTKNPEDAQKTFDMLATKEKEIIWVSMYKKSNPNDGLSKERPGKT